MLQLLFLSVIYAYSLRYLTQFPFEKPGFLTAHRNPNNATSWDLIISSFGIGILKPAPDSVSFIPDIAEKLQQNKEFRAERISRAITWPNEVNLLDNKHLVVAGGFLVPGKKGHISVLDYEKYRQGQPEEWKEMIQNKRGFFHRVEKANIYNRNPQFPGDDGQRIVTCRGEKSIFGKSKGEMIFLEPKGNYTYEEHVIAPNCDCFFASADFNGDGIPEFVIASFFSQKLILQWTEHPLGDYSKQEFIRQKVIDDSIGAVFDIQMIDFTKDGQLDIMVTNHQSGKKGPKPALYVYQVETPALTFQPESFTASLSNFMDSLTFTRKTISHDFDVINNAFMSAGPGGAQAFYPFESNANEKDLTWPSIVVSGDGTEKAYLLQSKEAAIGPHIPDFNQTIFHDCKGTVGGILVEDIDNDGWKEVFVPCYDTNYIAVYTFKPE